MGCDYLPMLYNFNGGLPKSSLKLCLDTPDRKIRLWLLLYALISVNTSRPRKKCRHFADKCIRLDENVWISIKISLEFVFKRLINTFPSLVQIMTWYRPGDKPLPAPMMVSLPTHKCVIRQWVDIC